MQETATSPTTVRSGMTAGGSSRLFSFDLIRTIATLLIILYHFDLQLLAQAPSARIVLGLTVLHQAIGDLGVTLFIILSGAALMMSATVNFSLLDYSKKRFLGIFPSYWVAYLVVGALLFLLRGAWPGGGPHWKFIYTVLGLDGFLLYRGPNYYILGEWFIGFILCLYVIFPLLRKGVLRRPFLTWLLVALLFLVLQRYHADLFTIILNRNPLVRIPEFLFGICYGRYIAGHGRAAFAISALALVGFACKVPPVLFPVYGILLGMAVFCCATFLADRIPFPPSFRNLVAMAARYSFLAFLVHHQIIYVLLSRFDVARLTDVEVHVLFAIVVALSFALAVLLDKWVSPLTRWLRHRLFRGRSRPECRDDGAEAKPIPPGG